MSEGKVTLKLCVRCGKEFRDGTPLRQRVTCSPECSRQNRNHARRDGAIIKTCAACGTDFEPKQCSRAIVCSESCRTKYRREYAREYYTRERGDKPCAVCGTIFKDDSRTGHIKFCSDSCRTKRKKENELKRLANPNAREPDRERTRRYRAAHREQRRDYNRERYRVMRLAYQLLKQFPGVLQPNSEE